MSGHILIICLSTVSLSSGLLFLFVIQSSFADNEAITSTTVHEFEVTEFIQFFCWDNCKLFEEGISEINK